MVGLTVDHGLRPSSRAEASRVGGWLERRGITHHILRWGGEKPPRGVQAAARAARYDLMRGWCARRGALHLLLAHHLEDQAETFVMRLGRGSGVEGLAAMAPLSSDRGILLARPFLGIAKARLMATLHRAKQPWIEDPSNRDPAFARVRVRDARDALEAVGLSSPRLARTARHMARARAALEADATDLLARSVKVHPAGFCVVDPIPFAAAADEISLRALSRVLTCVAGADYPPRFERLARLGHAIAAGLDTARTLKGCRVARWRACILVSREAAAAAEAVPLAAGAARRWDGRFTVKLAAPLPAHRGEFAVARLGLAGWRQVVQARPEARETDMPAPARTVVPALWRSGRVVAVPHLDFDAAALLGGSRLRFIARFQPPRPLAAGSFAVAIRQPALM